MGMAHDAEYAEYVSARYSRLHRAAHLLCGDPHRADDLVQATLLSLYLHWKRAAAADNLDAYVHRIMVRRLVDEHRRGWSRDGKVTFLRPPPGNWHIYPWPAINAGGDIVINAEPMSSVEGANSFAFYWPTGSDTAVKIPLPEGANVYAISDSRLLVGAVYKGGLAVAGYTWDLTGKGTKLETPAGATSVGYAIRGDWVAGGGGTGKMGGGWGAVWDLRTGELTKLPQGASFNSVNAQGWVAMETEVWAAGTLRPLESPLATNRYRGIALSDTGLVVGSATPTRDSADSPARATPVSWQC